MEGSQQSQKPTAAPKELELFSPDFEDARALPPEVAKDGADQHPGLRWGSVPTETKSLAILCEDPDAPGGTWIHWVVWNVPPEIGEFHRGQDLTDVGATEGMNDFGDVGYGGPAPPPGQSHRYQFKVFALDTRLVLPRGAKAGELRRVMEGRVLTWGEIAPRYSRPE